MTADTVSREKYRAGLSQREAAARLEQCGRNDIVPARKSGGALRWALRLIADPMVILLGVAGVTYALLGDRFDAVVVAIALIPIFAVTGILEYRSDRALERLSSSVPPRARVVRDGSEQLIPAVEVVPGDTLVLREGDVIAADGRLLDSNRLLVDESALTGESLPVEKAASPNAAASVLAGTIVRSGHGIVEIQRTGRNTEYGRIARTLGEIQSPKTPIEQSIHRIVYQVGVAVIFGCALVVAVQRLHGDPWAIAIIAGVSLAMAAIPEELPMVYTLYLALGAWRLARDNALVRHLSSVETLGATTVICVDKTGTLTFGKLSIQSVIAADGFADCDVLATAALASDERSGDPVDDAILAKASVPLNRASRELELPFDPARRYAAAIWHENARHVLAVKGAYEALLSRTPERDGDRARLTAFHDAATMRGARVLAVGRALLDRADETAIETAPVHLAGLIALADGVRPAAVEAVAKCRGAGIRFVMITGDHPATAKAIAAAAGLDSDAVVSGEAELQRWSDDELREKIRDIDVFARVRPEQKLRIVRALHAGGEIVAMTGDGTNDALALREADIGVAMGEGGTEVARAAADLVLLDDNVTTIVRAVADGRRIFHNLRHAFTYLVAFHAPLLLSAFLLPLIGAPIFLLPIHLIWLELIVHPTSALVLENDPPEKNLMQQPPRPASSGLLRRSDWLRATLVGGVLAVAVTGIFVLALRSGLSADEARTAGVITMIAGQIMLVFVERAGRQPIWRASFAGNRAIAPVVLGTAATLFVALLWPPMAHALHLAPISVELAAGCCIGGWLAVLWEQPWLALRSRPAEMRGEAV